ncbi:MAG: hypothetical protein ACRC3G_01945 [Bacteroidales bacterium]
MQISRLSKEEQNNAKILAERDKHFAALQKVSDDYAKTQADKDTAELLAIEQKYAKAKLAEDAALKKQLVSKEEHLLRMSELDSMMEGELAVKRTEQKKRQEKEEEAFEKKKLEIRKRYSLISLQELEELELSYVENLYDDKLLTEREYLEAREKINEKYRKLEAKADAKAIDDWIKERTEKLATITAAVDISSGLIRAMEDAEIAENDLRREEELAKLTEHYNEQIAAAGDNEEQQTAIKQEYEAQKAQIDYQAASDNVETQKKYADANFAVQATQAAATGIVSAMNAFSAMAGIPIVGPALGAAAAVAVGVTTALQIKQLNAERQRIKSVTIEAPTSSSGSNSTPTPNLPTVREVQQEDLTGSNVVNAFAGGKYDVISDEDGETYSAPLVQTTTGVVTRPTLVAERPELVVGVDAFPYLQRHINYPMVVDAINDSRAHRTCHGKW